jgi:DNA-binding beta-propeller fold protein YncE
MSGNTQSIWRLLTPAMLCIVTYIGALGQSAPVSQNTSLAAVATLAPADFRESRLDRLSGGIPHLAPFRMVADSKGRILVTDPALSLVHVFDTREGKHWQIKSDAHHRLGMPTYIAVDSDDNIYVADLRWTGVVVLGADGRFKRVIGLGILNRPAGIWIDKANQRVYVADWWKDEIFIFDEEGALLHEFGERGPGPGQLNGPLDIAVYQGSLVVLDAGNFRFTLFDLQGRFRNVWPFGPDRKPSTFTFDNAGHLYYVDLNSRSLVVLDSGGKIMRKGDLVHFGQMRLPDYAQTGFRCLGMDSQGKVLAVKPTLELNVFQVVNGPGG